MIHAQSRKMSWLVNRLENKSGAFYSDGGGGQTTNIVIFLDMMSSDLQTLTKCVFLVKYLISAIRVRVIVCEVAGRRFDGLGTVLLRAGPGEKKA